MNHCGKISTAEYKADRKGPCTSCFLYPALTAYCPTHFVEELYFLMPACQGYTTDEHPKLLIDIPRLVIYFLPLISITQAGSN